MAIVSSAKEGTRVPMVTGVLFWPWFPPLASRRLAASIV
jgi:hypothetical protein